MSGDDPEAICAKSTFDVENETAPEGGVEPNHVDRTNK